MTVRPPPSFWGLHARPSPILKWVLGILPFVLLVAGYLVASRVRLEANPQDKLLPSVERMVESSYRLAFEPDTRSGNYILLEDTVASLKRLAIGSLLAAACGLLLGMNMGLFRGMSALLLPFITFVSIIPPLTLLPILFITLGVEEVSKIALIFIGIAPVITRDMYQQAGQISIEQITKTLTLGGSQLAIVYRVVLPQLLPRLIESIRLSLGAGWLFLIASEAIASTNGLGYRIFLVRRYLAMDIIIPYALWITLLGFLADFSLKHLIRWMFPWYSPEKS